MKRIGSPHFGQLGRRKLFGMSTGSLWVEARLHQEEAGFQLVMKALFPEKAPEAKKEEPPTKARLSFCGARLHVGARKPGDESHSSMCAATSS